MGGRGSSSGISVKGKPYGSEYTTVLQSGNIKFVRTNSGSATPPLETMTKGRIYVTLNYDNKPKFITYYNKKNKHFKQIDLDKAHIINGIPTLPHTHKGYYHNEKGDFVPSGKENKMVDKVLKTWYYHNNK